MPDLTLRAQTGHAHDLIRYGNLEDGAAVCRRILESFPRYIKAYTLLGHALLKMDRLQHAESLYRRALSADPEHVAAFTGLALIAERRGEDNIAQAWLERTSELLPAGTTIGDLLDDLGFYTDLSTTPGMTRAGLARLYLHGHMTHHAVRELQAIVNQAPDRHDLIVTLAEAYWRQGAFGEAAQRCEQILAALPYCLKGLLLWGQIKLNTDQDRQARERLQRAQLLDPDNVVAQELFGNRSPLPPRTARLPFRDEDAPFLELPYLFDDEDEEEQDEQDADGPLGHLGHLTDA